MPAFYTAKSPTPGAAPVASVLNCGDILICDNTFGASHCGIVVKDNRIMHAATNEVDFMDVWRWGRTADIFRPSAPLTTEETDSIHSIACHFRAGAKYGLGRAIGSAFGSGAAGPKLRARLAKYRERMLSEATTHQSYLKNVYCSELVIVSYQLTCFADKVLDEKHKLWIPLDGKKTFPSTLRTFLRTSPNFREMGKYATN